MNKIEEIKNALCWNPNVTMEEQGAFCYGFDAAMELQLPVKFLQFWWEGSWLKLDELKDLNINNSKELYDYWIKNIYPTQQ